LKVKVMQPSNTFTTTRRDVLKAAAGMGLSFLLPGLELRASQERGPARAKSLLTLWLGGGPSQLETWDPHPGPAIGGQTEAIDTVVPGLKIAHFYPQTAEEIGSLSVIRSLVSKEGDHERGTYLVKTGYRPDPTLVHPALGAIVAHELPNPKGEIPQHVALGGGEFAPRGGFLGDAYDAFKVYDPGRNIENLRAGAEPERQERRLKSLDVVSETFRRGRRIPAEKTLHQDMIARALRMMTSEQLRAFDLEHEPRSVRQAYGDSRFGRGCLVARRLLEEGVRAIEVTLGGFDSHANNHEAHRDNAAVLDPALAALLKDLRERDLLDSTVVLCIGEFGRTPKINPLAGRDHWPTGFSCLVGGGGLRAGVVIGETDPTGTKKDPADPVEIQDLYATILKTLGVDYQREFITPIGRPMAFSKGTPIARLFSQPVEQGTGT
jgi:hypothetical protein